MEKIVISKSDRKLLNSKYGTWNVSRALNYRQNSFLCREIRKIAIEKYNGQKFSYKKVEVKSN